jgi:hypothetical protein
MSNFECGSPRASPWHLPVRPLGGTLSDIPAMAGARVEGSSAVENLFEKNSQIRGGKLLDKQRPEWSRTALRPWHLSTRFIGRNPPKRTLLAYSAEAVASAAKAGGFTPVAFCEGG